jgi:2-succinyl-6-hydroxy-2,4-cyclohexadiene-1-carboxylate synthase
MTVGRSLSEIRSKVYLNPGVLELLRDRRGVCFAVLSTAADGVFGNSVPFHVIGLAVAVVSAKVSVMFLSNTPVLLLHGFLGSAEDWDPVCQAWGMGSQRAKPFELKKNLYSAESNEDAWDSLLTTILAYMDEHNRDGPWDIVGYSMGGRIAWMLAYRYPHRVRRLCILSANPGLSSSDERQFRAIKDQEWADCLCRDGMETFLRRWYAQPLFALFRQHPLFASIVNKRVNEDPAMQAMIVMSLSPAYQPDLWSWVLASQIPTLYLSGEADTRYTDIGKRLSENTHVRCKTIPNAGHVLHLEAPVHVATVLRQFLN